MTVDDLRDLTLAVARSVTDDGVWISFGDLLSTYGLSRADLAADPVPDWLFKQLVHTAGVPPHEVAAMTGEEAFARWNAWMARS